MNKVLPIMLTMVTLATTVQAKTAQVELTYVGSIEDTVAVLVSDADPDFHLAMKQGDQVVGAVDQDKDGKVEIGGIIPGNTYHFRAVAWDANGNLTPFSNVYTVDVPAEPPFEIIQYPPIEVEGKAVFIQVTIK